MLLLIQEPRLSDQLEESVRGKMWELSSTLKRKKIPKANRIYRETEWKYWHCAIPFGFSVSVGCSLLHHPFSSTATCESLGLKKVNVNWCSIGKGKLAWSKSIRNTWRALRYIIIVVASNETLLKRTLLGVIQPMILQKGFGSDNPRLHSTPPSGKKLV